VLGFALLAGRCGDCKTPISFRYPAVETVCAALCLAVSMPWLLGLLHGELDVSQALGGAASEQCFVLALIAIALIDADTFMIPDVLSLPLPLLGIATALWIGDVRGVSWQQSASGALLAGALLLALQLGYAALSGREGLGTGDVKLLAGLGAWLGVQSLPVVLLLAALQGIAFALGLLLIRREQLTEDRGLTSLRHLALPFGPFLALAGIEWLLLHRHAQPLLDSWLNWGM
jgi:leader peptidase (prepilin peptidase)/N-methyltransferase